MLLPFAIAGMKTAYSATKLRNYERGKGGYNENKLSKGAFVLMFLLLAAAYVPPVSGFVLSWKIYAALFVFSLPFGICSEIYGISAHTIIPYRSHRS